MAVLCISGVLKSGKTCRTWYAVHSMEHNEHTTETYTIQVYVHELHTVKIDVMAQ